MAKAKPVRRAAHAEEGTPPAGSPGVPADGAGSPVLTPFQLSRVYAKGWAAGMNCPADDPEPVILARAEAMNPCAAGPARARWMQGFSEALQRKLYGPDRKPAARQKFGAAAKGA